MSERNLIILAIDDDEGDIEIVKRCLMELRDFDIELITHNHWQEAMTSLIAYEPDIIFIDYHLGTETGLDVFNIIRSHNCDKPVVMLTGQGNELVAVEAMKAGVADYVVKEQVNPENLLRVITNALSKYQLEKEIRLKQMQLEELARTDELTGFWNRRYLIERLQEYAQESLRYGFPFSFLLIDLDHFKSVNDEYGHLTGDKVLSESAWVIKQAIRRTDHAGRYGGEELCVILTNTVLEGAKVVAERIRETLAEYVFRSENGVEFHITCSVGIAQYHFGLDEINLLFNRADRALYAAKNVGRNRTVSEEEIDFVEAQIVNV